MQSLFYYCQSKEIQLYFFSSIFFKIKLTFAGSSISES